MRLSSFARRTSALALVVVSLAGASHTHAQGGSAIAGTVTDSVTQQPIPGVQVIVVGTNRGSITDEGGRYSLRGLTAGTYSIRAQRIGYAFRERSVAVGADMTADVDFSLAPVARVLTEVVATGYGTSIRRELSSSIASVQAEEITNAPVAGVDAALQGKAPGVQVIQNAGNPGVGITVRVRGAASISASNQPLWVIDGVPMIREDFSQIAVGGQDITAVTGISPDEIESIDILKDAAAAAIYGSRAANGVVMIRTKRGRAGRPRFSFNVYSGIQETAKKLDLLNAQEFVEYANEAFTNDGYAPVLEPGVDDAINTDWQQEVLRSAPVSDIFLSVDGGNERVRYLVGGSYFDQKGIVRGSGYDRQTIRANLDFDPTSRLSFRSSIALSRELHERVEGDNTIEGVYANAIASLPMFPVRQPDGRFTNTNDVVGYDDDIPLTYINPVAVADLSFNESRSLRSYGTIESALRITDRMRLNARAGYDVLNLRDLAWESPNVVGSLGESVRGRSVQAHNTATRYMLESYLSYDLTGGILSQLNFTGGASVEWNTAENDFLRGEGFAHTAFQYPGNASRITTYDGDRTGHNLVSFFARSNATLRDRYLFSASIRADGSSRFGEENRYGYFPAVSLGWIVSDEPMFAGLRDVADVKLRASYGETGNQDIGDDFAPIARYSEAKYAGAPGIAPENIANQELKWETNREYDVGVDVGLLSGRVNLVLDWYLKKTEDLLIQRPITRTTGFSSFWDNIGNIENRGFEIGFTTVNVEPRVRDGFRWESNFNITWNRNEITHLYNNEPFNRGFDGINRYEVGLPMGAFYTVKFTGVNPENGDAMFFDLDGDGDVGEDSDDRMVVGSPHPDYWGGLTNTVSFKGFDLRAFVQFSQGASIYNGLRAYADDGVWSLGDNKLQHVMRRWRQPGDITDVPRPSWDGGSLAYITSSRWIEDASYIRLQEITLGYQLPERIAGMANVAQARVFVSGRNLKTWSDYLGFNPEANSAGSSSLTTMQNEFYSYPLARTITFGVQGSF